jgi:hypothetical protein
MKRPAKNASFQRFLSVLRKRRIGVSSKGHSS